MQGGHVGLGTRPTGVQEENVVDLGKKGPRLDGGVVKGNNRDDKEKTKRQRK
jgi:hypothetical protein